MNTGKWTCSTNEEHWDCGEEFDTREEAIAFAMLEFGDQFEDGQRFYTGQIAAVPNVALAIAATPSVDSILDSISEWLYENVGDGFEDSFSSTKEQDADLETRMLATVRQWLDDHKLAPNCFMLEHVQGHVWEQCKETRPAELGDRPLQCLLAIEHDGECEWQ